MEDFKYRTEDIRIEEILGLYVPTTKDMEIVAQLKSSNPIILEGSRGTGKSLLLRVAEAQFLQEFSTERILPVYVTFRRSPLIQTTDNVQFHNWMLARVCTQLLSALRRSGILTSVGSALSRLAGQDNFRLESQNLRIEQIARAYEESYKNPGQSVDSAGLPDVDELRDAIEDLCSIFQLKRITLFFDEAAHIFRPEQQRQFFTLFRDLRSPYIACKAAVYPGVTSFGDSFQKAHDATWLQINRDYLSPDYVKEMRQIVERQASSDLLAAIARNEKNFAILALAVSGNPRLLLKTVAKASKMNSQEINAVIKDFYLTDIWSEHSNLIDLYPGHKSLILWGRQFIEGHVLKDTKKKNDARRSGEKNESTCYFWIHRDSPEPVTQALRLLSYTGTVMKESDGIKATRSEIGTRYAINLGCLFALEPKAAAVSYELATQLNPKRFTEYGANHASYKALINACKEYSEPDVTADVFDRQLAMQISVLDITAWQRDTLLEAEYETVGDVLQASELGLQSIRNIGEKRSRRIMNAALASVLEYLSG